MGNTTFNLHVELLVKKLLTIEGSPKLQIPFSTVDVLSSPDALPTYNGVLEHKHEHKVRTPGLLIMEINAVWYQILLCWFAGAVPAPPILWISWWSSTLKYQNTAGGSGGGHSRATPEVQF